ncbi:MAG TPA: endolytic transglycosylase MltG [Candidatus Paceibacterota bacterium]|jgi:UPF0755 protein|nr:endolytic transglycosylase MltG [Candidatus Paceibacterota bacterium]HRS47765.1 endolytic transglycosylase MltG [Candidatus Paceibacterota bacterium]
MTKKNIGIRILILTILIIGFSIFLSFKSQPPQNQENPNQDSSPNQDNLIDSQAVNIYPLVFNEIITNPNFDNFQNSTSTSGIFIVYPNSNLEKIVADLKKEGILVNDFYFYWQLLASGTTQIQPGGYAVDKPMDPIILSQILTSEPDLLWITIPEGLRKEEIAFKIAEVLNWNEDQIKRFIIYNNNNQDYKEGVYFPDTYLIPKNEEPEKTAQRLINKFQEKISPFNEELTNQNISWLTVLKLASIIQREAGSEKEMSLISGILWNRLDSNMNLEVDSSLQYIKGTKDNWWPQVTPQDKQLDSPYNTFKYKGLPPTPISNPGLEAIKAAIYPQNTNCLFYFHKDNIIYCSKTYKEHQQKIEEILLDKINGEIISILENSLIVDSNGKIITIEIFNDTEITNAQSQKLTFENFKIGQKLEALGELNQDILKADKLIINN